MRRCQRRGAVRVEDAHVGFLAREAGVVPSDISDLVQDPPAGRAQLAATYAGQLLVHRVRDFSQAFIWMTHPVWTPMEQEMKREARRGGRGSGGGGGGRGTSRARKLLDKLHAGANRAVT